MSIEKYLREIDDKTIGIVWFSKEPIENEGSLHELFDYLVDGQVGKFLDYAKDSGKSLANENMYFVGRSFNSQLIVFNTSSQREFSEKDFNDFKMILEKLETKGKSKLIVVHPEGHRVPQVISKSDFEVHAISS